MSCGSPVSKWGPRGKDAWDMLSGKREQCFRKALRNTVFIKAREGVLAEAIPPIGEMRLWGSKLSGR